MELRAGSRSAVVVRCVRRYFEATHQGATDLVRFLTKKEIDVAVKVGRYTIMRILAEKRNGSAIETYEAEFMRNLQNCEVLSKVGASTFNGRGLVVKLKAFPLQLFHALLDIIEICVAGRHETVDKAFALLGIHDIQWRMK